MEKEPNTLDLIQSHLTSLNDLFKKLNSDEEKKATSSVYDDRGVLGDFPHRVIHLKNNPIEMEVRKKEERFKQLEKENERLRARLELLESGDNVDVTRRIDDAVNNAHQIEVLTRKLDELKRREDKILDSFRRTSREFREVCYLLTGYKIGALKDRVYVLSNMYAEREDDKLFFEISPDGSIQLLKNSYSDQLSGLIETYLERADSFPAFLASLTLDLFKSTTQQEHQETLQSTDMSVTMSTTILPNLNYNKGRG